MISNFNFSISRLPDIAQKCFCTPDGAKDPTFQMRYVAAGDISQTILDACFWDTLYIKPTYQIVASCYTQNPLKSFWGICLLFVQAVLSSPLVQSLILSLDQSDQYPCVPENDLGIHNLPFRWANKMEVFAFALLTTLLIFDMLVAALVAVKNKVTYGQTRRQRDIVTS